MDRLTMQIVYAEIDRLTIECEEGGHRISCDPQNPSESPSAQSMFRYLRKRLKDIECGKVNLGDEKDDRDAEKLATLLGLLGKSYKVSGA